MKRLLSSFMLPLGLLALAACERERTPDPFPTAYTVTASLEAPTRTVLFDGTKVYWKPQDQIAVFDGHGATRFTAAIDQDAPVAEFQGAGPIVLDGGMLYAVYPYGESSTCEDGVMSAELPARQQALAGTFDDDLLVTAAQSRGTDMSFYNACSGIRFTLTTEGVRRVIVRSNGGESIAGTLRMQFSPEGALQASAMPGGPSQVVLDAPAGETFQPGVSYYVILAPGQLARGLTMEFLTEGTACCKTLERPIELKRSIFGSLTEADNGLVWDQLADPVEYLFNADPATDYSPSYWDAARRLTLFNVSVPYVGSTAPELCVYRCNLNLPFVTWPIGSEQEGQLKLANTGGYRLMGVRYCFSEAMTQLTKAGSLPVTYSVSEDGETLYAALEGAGAEVVATIDNADPDLNNSFTVNRNSAAARALVNTGRFHVLIGATGYICGHPEYQVRIAFNRRPYFEAGILPTLYASGTARDGFIDGVDIGEKGSFIRLEDLVDLKDWRGRSFDDYPNYWDYYGPFSFSADLSSVLCQTGDFVYELPASMELEQNNLSVMGKDGYQKTSRFGFLTYHNNSVSTNSFTLYVSVTVTHGWGILSSGYIAIPVQGTFVSH